MQSFYLSNSQLEEKSLSILNKQLIRQEPLKLKDYLLNFFYSEGKQAIYKKEQFFISNLGVFIYKNHYNNYALKLFMDDLLSGKKLEDLLLSESTKGQFCLILYYKNEIKIITDRLGYFPVYVFQKGPNISLSNSMLLLAKNNKNCIIINSFII